jgi:hypothetical protein
MVEHERIIRKALSSTVSLNLADGSKLEGHAAMTRKKFLPRTT